MTLRRSFCRLFNRVLLLSGVLLGLSILLQHFEVMSPLPTLRAANKAFFTSLHTPTAVFVGGTSGIGRAMAEALAAHTEGNANIVIVGRNRKAAQEILASFPSSSAKREFIESDVTKSISGLSSVTAQIAATFPDGIDFLVLTPGYAAMDGRIENEEGIDRKMAVNYYARWKFIYDLAPILREGGKVISVLGAGYGGKIDVEDLGLKKPGAYSVSKVAMVTPTYTDLMMQVCFDPTHLISVSNYCVRASLRCTPSIHSRKPTQVVYAPITFRLPPLGLFVGRHPLLTCCTHSCPVLQSARRTCGMV